MITLGSDPEFIIGTQEGELVSSHTAGIKGSKDSPKEMQPGFFVHRDNVLVELGIKPSSTEDEWVSNHKKALSLVKELIGEYTLVNKAAAWFPFEELWHPEASIFGCEPDISAWDSTVHSASVHDADNLRVAGGHIHVGYGSCDKEFNQRLVKCMDLLLGVPSVLMDSDRERRKLYGLSGSYRDKPYGMEYRVLSNFWMFNEEHMRWVYESTMRAVEMAKGDMSYVDNNSSAIQSCINNYDESMAESLIEGVKYA